MPDHRFGLHPHRIRIEGDLVVKSPLHVGTGDFAEGLLDVPEGAEAGPGVAAIVRDGRGVPLIPGSSLKGLLRRLCASDEEAKALFGDVKLGRGGHISSVFVWTAAQTVAGDPGEAPYAARVAAARPGAFVAARTRIARETGTADHNKLFFQEVVPAGARFRMRLLLVADDEPRLKAQLDLLRPVLGALAGGATLGKGQADGQGFVALDRDSVRMAGLAIGPDGAWRETTLKPDIPQAAGGGPGVVRHWDIKLRCTGPFAIVDSSHQPAGSEDERNEQRRRNRNDPAPAQLKAQRTAQDRPLVPGSSIMGVLRARAAWLQALKDGNVTDGQNELCPNVAAAKDLLPSERLFGVTGFRGLLALEDLRVPAATPWTVTSVKLDRFSGAPFDTGLFSTATFVNVQMSFRLVLRDRSDGKAEWKAAAPTAADLALAAALIEDLEDNGLMLGHGTNKGFGWFDCVKQAGG